MKYLLLFIGGTIPGDKKEQSVKDRLSWMESLRDQGKFVDGSPLSIEGKTIEDDFIANYQHDTSSTNGYAIIEAADLDEAVRITKPAPQLKSEYGGAIVEIRPLQPLE